MFVRRKQNKSGTTSIQVIAKVDGKYRLQKSFGSSRDESILASLERQARQWADEHEFGEELFAPEGAEEYDAIFAGFLVMTGDGSIRIDYDKVARDERLDGYKGCTTNSVLPDDRIIEEYGYLFMIERAFRFCKTDLDIKPNCQTSSQPTAKMGVPLRKTGKMIYSYC